MRETDSQHDADATDAPHHDHPRDGPPASDGRDATPGDSPADAPTRTDGGTVAATDAAAPSHEDVDYLDREVNIFRPSTPFMRDHLRVVWTMFAAWAVVVFGPVTATVLAPDAMTSVTVIGFPLHYVTTAIGAPGGALVLSLVYARKRDQLDEKYGIDHGADADTDTGEDDPAGEATAADGGVAE